MGVFIDLQISKSVTKKEWESVYEETLQLIRHFPLAEKSKALVHGIETICLIRTAEQENPFWWCGDKTRPGWNAVGDYTTMHTGEDYYLPRDLVREREPDPEAGDALLGALPNHIIGDRNDEKYKKVYYLWGNKTQGEPYHIYLLAVAALIEARLGNKAYTTGDITRGQFRKAVEMANLYLSEPIDLPDRCYMDRLQKRVETLPIPPGDRLKVFEENYLGTKDAEFGEFIRQTYPEDVIRGYWKEVFAGRHIGNIGFNQVTGDYLQWGFDLESLCSLVDFESDDNELKYEKFVKRILDAKLHLRDKNCADPLKIDQESENTYGIGTLFAQFAFCAAQNLKVDRFIPIEEIRDSLAGALSSKCDVTGIIDEYLAKEAEQIRIDIDRSISKEEMDQAVDQDASEVFSQMMEIKRREAAEEHAKYDICDYEKLPFYRDGDTLHPGIAKTLAGFPPFLASALEEAEYRELLQKGARSCCQWLADRNRYLLVRDEDWDRVFTKIESDIGSFGRYYGLLRVDMQNDRLVEMCKALLINEELYAAAETLGKAQSSGS